MAPEPPLLSVRNLVKIFPIRSGPIFGRAVGNVRAVSDISFDIAGSQSLGLVGESGCGKSTLGRCIVRLLAPSTGSILFRGTDLAGLSEREMRPHRRHLQMVFQDPYASLHPRLTVGQILAEPLRLTDLARAARADRVNELLGLVKLERDLSERYPHELSGGMRQRVGIARAIAVEPKLLVLDEPVSALDVSIRAGILNLLRDLQERLSLACLFISHDLSVVRHLCDRVAVMYLGKIVEIATREELYSRPRHPYTAALLSAVPSPEADKTARRKRIILAGDVPNPADPPSGCRFRTRCWKAAALCAAEEPRLMAADGTRGLACHFPETDQTLSQWR